MSLKSKIRLLFAAFILGLAGLGWFVTDRLAVVNAASAVISQHFIPLQNAAWAAIPNAISVRVAEMRHLMSTSAEAMAKEDALIKLRSNKVEHDFGEYRKMLGPGDDSAAISVLQEQWRSYLAGEEPTLAASRAGDKAAAISRFKSTVDVFDVVRNGLEGVVASNSARATQASQEADRIYRGVLRVVIGTVLTTLLAAVAGAVYFERNVTQAIRGLSACMNRLAGGDLTVSVPATARSDEIGAMARNVRVFLENGIAMRRLEAEAAAQRAAREAERAAVAARQAEVVERLALGLAELARGNLSFSLSEPFADEYERLRNDFNAALHAQHESRMRAQHDPLTGLLNRAGLAAFLSRVEAAAAPRFALFYLDLDGFKQVNDTCGHQVGDKLLQAVSARLRASVRSGDAVARLGGDEFVLVLPAMPVELCMDFGGRIVDVVTSPPYEFDGVGPVRVGISVGFACAPEDAGDTDALIRLADAALYEAKAAGKGVCRRAPRQRERRLAGAA